MRLRLVTRERSIVGYVRIVRHRIAWMERGAKVARVAECHLTLLPGAFALRLIRRWCAATGRAAPLKRRPTQSTIDASLGPESSHGAPIVFPGRFRAHPPVVTRVPQHPGGIPAGEEGNWWITPEHQVPEWIQRTTIESAVRARCDPRTFGKCALRASDRDRGLHSRCAA